MKRRFTPTLLVSTLLLMAATGVGATVYDRDTESPLAEKAFVASALTASPVNERIDDLPNELVNGSLADLALLGADPDTAILDSRGGRWRTLLATRPLIPGAGLGNTLTWESLGISSEIDDELIAQTAWNALRDYLVANVASLRIDVSELSHRIAVHDDGALVQIWADRTSGGLPVRGAGLSAVINHGNLVLLGAESWGDLRSERLAFIDADRALDRASRFVSPMKVDGLRQASTLTLLPAPVDGDFAVGSGYQHRLAWVVQPEIAGDIGQWELLVDAHDGEILALQDLNHYTHERRIQGGVYPVSNDGIPPDGNMVSGYPMPFLNLSTGGVGDAGGNVLNLASQTTTLTGAFVNISDGCGAISETAASGDLDLGGSNGDTDCTVPPGASAGNTPAARTSYYEVNRLGEIGRGQVGSPWLAQQLPTLTNISPFCNAFWTGTSINFFSAAAPCANTGEIAGVINHEQGHGIDDNDVIGTIPPVSQGGGEGMADIYAALRGDVACIGRGFFANGALCGGYGDPCTAASGCTGIRSIDWADRTSGVPHTLTWVRANCTGITHCVGAAYSETVWDLLKRDLPTIYGMSNNTALEVTTRLTFIGAGNSTGWFDLTGPPPGGAACGASQGYLQFLAADDDDGNVANGTPHMTAIATAFGRHEIDCTPAFGGPVVVDSGCVGTPTTAPVVNLVATTFGADLSWPAVAGATNYEIFRTDGEHQCNFGKVRTGITANTSFSDVGLQKGRDYFYTVIPKGPSNSCFGPASPCNTRLGSDYVMSSPFPGLAGFNTTMTATGSAPGTTNYFIYGTTPGSVNIPGCGSLGINPFFILGTAIADAAGVSELTLFVPGTVSGATFLLQAVELTGCNISNVVSHTF